MNIIVAGDSYDITVTLLDGTTPVSVPGTATVFGGLASEDGVAIAGPWDVLEATAGSDWDNGVVVLRLDGADTATAMTGKARQLVYVEIQVHDGADIITRRSRTTFLLQRGTW